MTSIWTLLKKVRQTSNSQMEDGLALAARTTTLSIVRLAIDARRLSHSLILTVNLFTYSSWTWRLKRSKLQKLPTVMVLRSKNQECLKLVTGTATDVVMKTIATNLSATFAD